MEIEPAQETLIWLSQGNRRPRATTACLGRGRHDRSRFVNETSTTILFFGRVADRLGRERSLDRLDAPTVGDLRRRLAEADPAADILLDPAVRASVDRKVVPDSAAIHPGQEIAFFPVFSGG